MQNLSDRRLAFFLPGLYEGGAERVILNLAEGISAKGYAVDLVLARAEGPYMRQVPSSVRLIDLKAGRVASSLPALVKYLRQERPVAALSALFANLVMLWARRVSGLSHRTIITEHNSLSSVTQSQRDLRWQAYPMLARRFYPWSDAIVAVSKSVADDLAATAGISRERIQVIYNPIINPDLLQKSQMPLEHPWFCPGQAPVILAIGRLVPQKAFDTLIQAFSELRTKRPARLLILGEGDDRSCLEEQIRKLGLEQDVALEGFVQNPYPYIANAAVFALPSRWEGLPTVLVEALRIGCPVVATDCPGGSAEILQNGRFGKLVPVDNPPILADSLLSALDLPQLSMSSECWEPFEADTVVDRYLNLLLGSHCA